jgi:hypothetical protein
MARVTRRDVPRSGVPPAPEDTQTSGPAPRIKREERERHERLATALEWKRFETWCASNGLRSSPATPEAVALITAYITYLAATGRNVAIVARALLRERKE